MATLKPGTWLLLFANCAVIRVCVVVMYASVCGGCVCVSLHVGL